MQQINEQGTLLTESNVTWPTVTAARRRRTRGFLATTTDLMMFVNKMPGKVWKFRRFGFEYVSTRTLEIHRFGRNTKPNEILHFKRHTVRVWFIDFLSKRTVFQVFVKKKKKSVRLERVKYYWKCKNGNRTTQAGCLIISIYSSCRFYSFRVR